MLVPAPALALTLLTASGSAPNLILVTIDTLRADRVGAYGYQQARTPALDGLARDGVLVEDAVVQVPQTRPSHVSIFTGRQPYEHGVRDNASLPLDRRHPTLAEHLRRQGYTTGAFVGAYPVSRDSGLDRGFGQFDDPFGSSRAGRQQARSERRAGEVVDRALAWLERASTPFFLWIHVFDPHAPYEPPPPYDKSPAHPYDGEVAYTDSQLAKVLAWLDRAGLRDSTLVVATSDHGEGLGEHGEDEHLFFVYDTTLRVPLLLRWPGRLPAGTRVPGQFRSVDLLATLLDLMGVPALVTSGASRAAELRSGRRLPDNESYAESLYGELHYGYAPLRALRAEGWKYIHAPRAELYHLREDPGETRNRLDDRSQVAVAMRQRLLSLDEGSSRPQALAQDPEASERLAALGYLGGGLFTGAPSGADPKEGIEDFQRRTRQTRQALRLFEDGRYREVVELLEGLERPTRDDARGSRQERSYNVSFYLGRSLLALRRFSEAARHLDTAVKLAPQMPITYLYLSNAQAGLGRSGDALETLERGLTVGERSAELHLARGRLLLEQDRVSEARIALERARALDPDSGPVHAALSNLYRRQAELGAALGEARAAVRLAPGSADAHVALALALGAQENEREAADMLREALRLEPEHLDALFYLAAIERRAGRPSEALPLLERLLALAPDYPGAQLALEGTRASLQPPAAGTIRLRLLRVASRARAEEAVRRVGAGEPFARVARELSEDPSGVAGGDLGDVRPSDLAEPLRSAAARLEPGETGGVLSVAGGFVVLMRER